jgi:hypothetical protein
VPFFLPPNLPSRDPFAFITAIGSAKVAVILKPPNVL